MRPKLTIIVTCTDRKAAPSTERRSARNLPKADVDARAREWCQRLAEPSDTMPLRRLYRGETWAQVLELETAAASAGFEPELLVASAGLGLRSVDSLAAPYSATFGLGHEDSVSSCRSENQRWWDLLPGGESLTSAIDSEASTLFVLSESYASALARHFDRARDRDDVLVFGGSAVVPAHQRVPADLALRSTLGGTATSLNVRAAKAWLRRLKEPQLVSDDARSGWKTWTEEVRVVQQFDRKQLADDAVLALVRSLRATDPLLTKTRALRRIRDMGIACEQKRFGRLFAMSLEAS